MNNRASFIWLIPLLLLACGSVIADSATIAKAVNRYYAGFPEEALAALEPLALSGDVEAQYLLGNMLYSLSRSGNISQTGDPVKWYKMAADRDLPDAHYALGVVYQNRWTESRNRKQAAAAIVHYGKAQELGFRKAAAALDRMKDLSGISARAAAGLADRDESTATAAAETETAVPLIAEVKPPVPKPETPRLNPVAEEKPARQAAAPKPEADPAGRTAIASEAQDAAVEPTASVTLAQIADHCQKYTEAGFFVYAETIAGGLVTGKASVVQVGRDPENAEMRLVKFATTRNAITIFLNMYRVPSEIGATYKRGNEYPIAATIGDSKLSGSSCILNSSYYAPPTTG